MMEVLSQGSSIIEISSIFKEHGMAAVPFRGVLERCSGGHQTGFIEMAANELECYRTAVFGKAARKGNGWTSRHVEGAAEAQQTADQVRIFAERRHRADGRCGERLGRHGKKIDLFEQRPHRSPECFAAQNDLLIVGAGLLQTKFDQSGEPRTVV